jgi:ubiquinol-cytochrome c reductase cytochrome c1 subunit
MKKILAFIAAAMIGMSSAHAAGDGVTWDKAPNKVNDMAALQNGAKLFVNYCLSCHSAAFMRYNRLQDIGLTEKQIKDNLMFATDKVGETMKSSIDPKLAKEWFGGNPPDLTLIARSRAAVGKGTGADYLYTLLRTYHRDDTKGTGWNNFAYPNIGMPNPLWELQGVRTAEISEVRKEKSKEGVDTFKLVSTKFDAQGANSVVETVLSGAKHHVGEKTYKMAAPVGGSLTPLQYEQAVGDLVAFLQWMGEPNQNQRVRIGVWVLMFLGVFWFIAWRLNASYWKDVK